MKNCKSCGIEIHRRKTFCQQCEENRCRTTKNGIINNNSVIEDVIYKNHHKSAGFALIRSRSRKLALDNGMNSCLVCGSSTCIEICHIKPISEFDPKTKISEVNSLDNLCVLCPNHHWEFDHGLIKLPKKSDTDNYCI